MRKGNGNGIETGVSSMVEAEAPSSRSLMSRMFGDMFGGMGEVVRLASDPTFQSTILSSFAAMAEGSRRSARIEAKIDLLLEEQGIDVAEFNRQFHAETGLAPIGIGLAALPPGSASDRSPGGNGAAAPPPHPGSGEPPPAARQRGDNPPADPDLDGVK